MEEPHSLTEIGKTGDRCVIVLELSENESFFDKKKNLLQSKGFDIREQISLDGLLSSDSVAATLEKMLEIARIIQLDEVELYFDDFDERSTVEFCSDRNEVEALNSVLSLVNSTISGKRCMETNVLQALQDKIIDRIDIFVEKTKVEATINKNYSCDKEKCLVEWGKKNGVMTRLEIVRKSLRLANPNDINKYTVLHILMSASEFVLHIDIEEAGRGAIASKDLKAGDLALEIPVSLIICEDLVRESSMYQVLKQIDGISDETILLLWGMKERHNLKSRFKTYFDALPKEFKTGLSFGVDAIMALDGTLLLEEIMQAKEHLRVQYDELVPALCNNYPDEFPPELYTWEQFLWACELWYSNSMKVLFADGQLRTCLIPIAGFLNHSLHPHIVHYGKVDPTSNSLKFPLSRPCRVGEECCLSYGNYSGSHLITFYGFLPQGENPYDVIPLDIDVGEVCIEDGPSSTWTAHMVRGTWLSKNHGLFCYGLPAPLLDYLQKARSPNCHPKTITQSTLESEMEVLEDLQSTFKDMMDNLGDSDISDRENSVWDVGLALQYKDLVRKIVFSVLRACDAGLNLVQNELLKCTAE